MVIRIYLPEIDDVVWFVVLSVGVFNDVAVSTKENAISTWINVNQLAVLNTVHLYERKHMDQRQPAVCPQHGTPV